MVVLECVLVGSIAVVIASEIYLLKKLFMGTNFPLVNKASRKSFTSSSDNHWRKMNWQQKVRKTNKEFNQDIIHKQERIWWKDIMSKMYNLKVRYFVWLEVLTVVKFEEDSRCYLNNEVQSNKLSTKQHACFN